MKQTRWIWSQTATEYQLSDLIVVLTTASSLLTAELVSWHAWSDTLACGQRWIESSIQSHAAWLCHAHLYQVWGPYGVHWLIFSPHLFRSRGLNGILLVSNSTWLHATVALLCIFHWSTYLFCVQRYQQSRIVLLSKARVIRVQNLACWCYVINAKGKRRKKRKK